MVDIVKVYRTIEKTKKTVLQLRAEDEEDWTYEMIPLLDKGLALIAVYDNVGEFIGYL